MEKVYLGLGTNLGDKEKNLRTAVELIGKINAVELTAVSSIYQTEPWGYTEQNDFLNLCVELKTDLEAAELLGKCQKIENELGRIREERWGPRIIDIDILIYDDLELVTPELTIPHPRIEERAFVLVPLQELNPELVINDLKIGEWLDKIEEDTVTYYSSY
ncbi:MAG: 2-amino-4-hydroxy-6-hydroxymethyldihydropteridine diphosphokinase [Bacillota bacterium]